MFHAPPFKVADYFPIKSGKIKVKKDVMGRNVHVG